MSEEKIIQKLETIEKKMDNNPSLWMDIEKVADYLSVSVSKIRKMVAQDRIPHSRLTDSKKSKLLFNRHEIDFWILLKEKRYNKRERNKVKDYTSKGGDK
jgi:excisionase family DNA binding protein